MLDLIPPPEVYHFQGMRSCSLIGHLAFLVLVPLHSTERASLYQLVPLHASSDIHWLETLY
jgi:hypothetical protein